MEREGIRRDDIVGFVHEMVNEIEAIGREARPDEILSTLEDTAERWARKIGRVAMQRGFELHRAQRPEPSRFSCSCGGEAGHKGRWDTSVSTVLGLVELYGHAYECRGCKQSVSPGLEQLGLNGRTFTPRLQEAMALLDTSLPERKATELFTRLLRVSVSAGTLSNVAVTWGEAWAEMRDEGQMEPPRRFGDDPIYASTDGMRVHTQTGWRELKVGTFYNQDKTHKCLCASFSPSDEFAHELGHYAAWTGAAHVNEVRCTGDGAEWVWNVLDTNFLDPSVRFIDIYHVHEHLWDYSKTAYGEGTAQAKRWATDKCHRLKHEGPGPILRSLARQHPPGAEAQEALRDLRGYMARHADRMDYPALIAQGIDIGNGPMENACKQLGARLKGADKRWRLSRAEAIAFLRAVYLSDEWDAFPAPRMTTRTAEQRRALEPLIASYNQAFVMN
jgi:hypothetical protein